MQEIIWENQDSAYHMQEFCSEESIQLQKAEMRIKEKFKGF